MEQMNTYVGNNQWLKPFAEWREPQVTLPDIDTLECWYLSLRETNPMAGYPVYQIAYDEYFQVFEKVYRDSRFTIEGSQMDKARLDGIRDDYRKRVKHNLAVRGHEEFRKQGYYWFSLWSDGTLSEPAFMALYRDDAGQMVDRVLAVLRNGNGLGLWMDAGFWADYMLVVFVGLLFTGDEVQRRQAVELALNLLPDIDDERIKAHVLVHLYSITREEVLRQEAEGIIASWGKERDLSEEDARLIDFIKNI